MKKWKKVIICIGIYWIICGVLWGIINVYRLNRISQYYLEEFKKSSVLIEKYGEITKVRLSFKYFFKTISYAEDKYIKECTIYTSNGSKHNLQLVYEDGEDFYAYLIDNELVYENEKERYTEIKESAKKASEHYLRALYPNCTISNESGETNSPGTNFNSSWLISNGLIKKDELLDVDKKSYCDVHVKAKAYFENPLDHQKNCNVYYQIYLKCMNYEDKGYVEL